MSDSEKKPLEFTDPEKRFLENMWVGFKAPPEVSPFPFSYPRSIL